MTKSSLASKWNRLFMFLICGAKLCLMEWVWYIMENTDTIHALPTYVHPFLCELRLVIWHWLPDLLLLSHSKLVPKYRMQYRGTVRCLANLQKKIIADLQFNQFKNLSPKVTLSSEIMFINYYPHNGSLSVKVLLFTYYYLLYHYQHKIPVTMNIHKQGFPSTLVSYQMRGNPNLFYGHHNLCYVRFMKDIKGKAVGSWV